MYNNYLPDSIKDKLDQTFKFSQDGVDTVHETKRTLADWLNLLLSKILILGGVNHRGMITTMADIGVGSYPRGSSFESIEITGPASEYTFLAQVLRSTNILPTAMNVNVLKSTTPHTVNGVNKFALIDELVHGNISENIAKTFIYHSANAFVDTFHNRYLFLPVLMPNFLTLVPARSDAESKAFGSFELDVIAQPLLMTIYTQIAEIIGWEHPLLRFVLTANQIANDILMLRVSNSYYYSASDIISISPTWCDVTGFLLVNMHEFTSVNAITYTSEKYRNRVFFGYKPDEYIEVSTHTWDSDNYAERRPIEMGIISRLIHDLQPELQISRAATIGVAGETGAGKTRMVIAAIDDVTSGKSLQRNKTRNRCISCTDDGLMVEHKDKTTGTVMQHLYAFAVVDEPMNPATRVEPIFQKSKYKLPKPRNMSIPVFCADFMDLFIHKIATHVNSVTFFVDSITSLLYTEDQHTIATTGTGLQAEGLRWYSRPLFLAINDLILASKVPIEFIMSMNVPLDARNVAYLIAGVSDFFIMLDRTRAGEIIVASSFSRHRHVIDTIRETTESSDAYIITNTDYYDDNFFIPMDAAIS